MLIFSFLSHFIQTLLNIQIITIARVMFNIFWMKCLNRFKHNIQNVDFNRILSIVVNS